MTSFTVFSVFRQEVDGGFTWIATYETEKEAERVVTTENSKDSRKSWSFDAHPVVSWKRSMTKVNLPHARCENHYIHLGKWKTE